MLWWSLLYINLNQSSLYICTHTYPLPVEPPSPASHPSMLHTGPRVYRSCLCCLWAPCVTHHLPTGYCFTYVSVYLSRPLSQFVLLSSSSRDITFPTKVCLVKTMAFPVIMYGCESWTMKRPEHRRIGAFELWCWRRLLSVP